MKEIVTTEQPARWTMYNRVNFSSGPIYAIFDLVDSKGNQESLLYKLVYDGDYYRFIPIFHTIDIFYKDCDLQKLLKSKFYSEKELCNTEVTAYVNKIYQFDNEYKALQKLIVYLHSYLNP